MVVIANCRATSDFALNLGDAPLKLVRRQLGQMVPNAQCRHYPWTASPSPLWFSKLPLNRARVQKK